MLHTRLVMRKRDTFVQDWQDWKSKKSRCSFPPLRFDNDNGFDAEEPREVAYERTKRQKLDELHTEREAEKKKAASSATA